jgi:cysteine synthase
MHIIPGPTYEEMLCPTKQPLWARHSAANARNSELDPANLFNIHWRSSGNEIRHVVLPHELTGVEANMVVLIGRDFPSGSHKVGPAYSILMESELAGEIEQGTSVIIAPSTGNFGIGVAYISKLKGYPAIVVMPDQMSRERYDRIRQYGAELDLTPGTESDVILVLERTKHYTADAHNKVMAQFELLPNYRFHRYVTGGSAIEAASTHGNGRVAAFVCAPGSAGTLAAGEEIKVRFPECVVAALEPRECPTLFNGGCGQHRIEGVGDKMVPLIHNVLSTDYVVLIHDDDCVMGLALVERYQSFLESALHLTRGSLQGLRGMFGVSGLCNVLGSIRIARFLHLGPKDNVVTVATDGFDRYPSVLADLEQRNGPVTETLLKRWVEKTFRNEDIKEILDTRASREKERLFRCKEELWMQFGYSQTYLNKMKSQSFWEEEREKIREIDGQLLSARIRT